MQHTREARDRLTLGYWIVLAGVAFALVAMVLPLRTTDGDSASIIETWSVTLVIGLPILASGALAFWTWNEGRGMPWPIVAVGILAVSFGLAFWFGSEEGTDAGIGALFLLAGGVLLAVGGVILSVVLRRVRIEAAVEAKVSARENADRMPAPVAALPPEGWYGDPRDSAKSRWWDGSRWTDATRRGAAEAASMPPPAA